ncbi:MAG: CidA/LrgA family protein [Methylovirgula sp.]
MRHFIIRSRHWLHHSGILQIGLLALFWAVGEIIANLGHLPVPGGIVGMLIVLGLLLSRRLSLFSTQRGAEWLLADMLLFFIPAVLVILGHHELFGLLGLKILAIICTGTLVVMIVTAVTVDFCYRWRAGRVAASASRH